MTITPTTLFRAAGVAAVAAGLIFIGVQINHPHSDVTSVTTTEWVVRNSLKVLMAALALAGITGMYLRQVKQIGVLGLIGYLVFGAGYLLITSTALISGYVLPSLADSNPGYVNDVLAAATNGTVQGDIGLLQTVIKVQGFAWLAGGLVFGIALFRARVLARWAAVLLAVGSVVTVLLAVMPDAFYRFLAFPNGIAMVALGYSLWRSARTDTATLPTPVDGSRVVPRQVPNEPAHRPHTRSAPQRRPGVRGGSSEWVIRRPSARRARRARRSVAPVPTQRWRRRNEPASRAVRAGPLRTPDRGAPRRALVRLVRRTDPHPRRRRHHHPAWRSDRPGRAARPARQGARPRHHLDLGQDHRSDRRHVR